MQLVTCAPGSHTKALALPTAQPDGILSVEGTIEGLFVGGGGSDDDGQST